MVLKTARDAVKGKKRGFFFNMKGGKETASKRSL